MPLEPGIQPPRRTPDFDIGIDPFEALRAIVERTAAGGADEEILEWCFSHGFRPNDIRMRVWNAVVERDSAGRTVARVNQRLGLPIELQTIFECLDADEDRVRQAMGNGASRRA